MARDVIERELTGTQAGRLGFDIAARGDDADIRRLLRENPMPGKISLSFEREPDYFADAKLPGETKQTIVARDSGRVVCVGSCTIRQRFVNGQPARVGYLGGLRLDASHSGRFDILRQGYEFFHQLQTDTPADFYFTSIAGDNARARSILERGLPGMPSYEFLGEFVTILLPAQPGHPAPAVVENRNPPAEQIVTLLNNHNRERQFAPCWAEDEMTALRPLGLNLSDFTFVTDSGRINAVAALWDQRVFKQTVVRDYAPFLTRARPVLNLAARFTGGTRLPAIGEVLRNGYVSHFAHDQSKPDMLLLLIAELRRVAAQRKVELLTLGFAANDPKLAVVRRSFRAREYHSRLYVVRWADCGGAARELDGRVLAPEVALL
jgi:hypothetical protein